MGVQCLTFLQQTSGSDLQLIFIYTAKHFSYLSLPYTDIKINIEYILASAVKHLFRFLNVKLEFFS